MNDTTWYLYQCTNQGFGFHNSVKLLSKGASFDDVWGWLRDDQNKGHEEEPDFCMTFDEALKDEFFKKPTKRQLKELVNEDIDEIEISHHEDSGSGLAFITTVVSLVIRIKKLDIVDVALEYVKSPTCADMIFFKV